MVNLANIVALLRFLGVVIIFETFHSINYAAILPQKPVPEMAHA